MAESNILAPTTELNQWRASPRIPMTEGLGDTHDITSNTRRVSAKNKMGGCPPGQSPSATQDQA